VQDGRDLQQEQRLIGSCGGAVASVLLPFGLGTIALFMFLSFLFLVTSRIK
jgi:hypothetical protein